LRNFVEGFGRRADLSTTLVASAALDHLSEDLQRAVFRVVQEALANTHRHAEATRVTVRARLARGTLFVSIRDNGHGIEGVHGRLRDLDEAPVGVGLPGMRARLRQFGGDLIIRSGRNGTRLTAMVPLTPNPSDVQRAA
jgi:signal transduction histidine kinase